MANDSKGDKAGWYGELAVHALSGIAAQWRGELTPMEIDLIAKDVQVAAQYNDVRYLSLQAYARNAAVKAAWFALITDRNYDICDPVDMPSDFVLGRCEFRYVLYRTGRQEQYLDLLNLEWPSLQVEPENRRLGVVTTLPRGRRLGVITSGRHTNVLLRRDADGLGVGDRVEFTVARSRNRGQVIAFLVTKVTEAGA